MFKKFIEDFTCEKCGNKVVGNGFTNHCPKCLWSKHVDVEPGDRASNCDGLMKPIRVEKEGEEYKITHKCIVCNHEKRNKSNVEDDFNELVNLSNQID